MTNEHPKMLYRCPGPITWEGIQHDQCIVDDADAEAAAVADGWHADVAKAKAAHDEAQKPAAVAEPEPVPVAPVLADPAPVEAVAEEAAPEPVATGKKKG